MIYGANLGLLAALGFQAPNVPERPSHIADTNSHPNVPASQPYAAANKSDDRPNIMWLHVESTDGRTYNDDMADVVPIPRIRSLQDRGAKFVNFYANIPICCPSRASVWVGRQAHNMPHEHNGIKANGAWSNYEGFGVANSTFDTLKVSDRLASAGYNINIGGKEDWLSGGHSSTTMVDSFSIYSRWPYSIPEEGGFHVWGDCGGNVTINPGNNSAHKDDWKIVAAHVQWLGDGSAAGAVAQQPWFAYAGMGIVHPPYRTDEEHWNRIPAELVTAPHWPAFDAEAVHPCDLQVSMKKGCARTYADLAYLNTTDHKAGIRRVYYAMISEWDDMVGAYIDAVDAAGLTARTLFFVSSDHGDMQMEHMQFYKMAAYEASTRVPLVVAGPGVAHIGDGNVLALGSLVDLMPTFLEVARAPYVTTAAVGSADPAAVDGTSLVQLMRHGDAAAASHPAHVVSQHHGENLAMSWYMVRRGEMKYVVWGTGEQHEPQLFNLTSDPDEWTNLARGVGAIERGTGRHARADTHPHGALVAELDALLRSEIDYPAVTRDVAAYNVKMARWWMAHEPRWHGVLGGTANASWPQPPDSNTYTLNDDWGQLWREHPTRYWDAWWAWVNATDAEAQPDIPACPAALEHGWHD